MRNIDRVKELEYELGRWQKKVSDQQKQIRELRGDLATSSAAFGELSQACDSVLIETARKFGEISGDEIKLVLPLVSIRRATRDYSVRAVWGEDNDSYIVTVTRKAETP